MGPASREFIDAKEPTHTQLSAALEELRVHQNSLAYWMFYEDWWALHQRVNLCRQMFDNKKVAATKGQVKQFWDVYRKKMKEGKWHFENAEPPKEERVS